MQKRNFWKKVLTGIMALTLLMGSLRVPCLAEVFPEEELVQTEKASTVKEGWRKDETGWWYVYKDGSYPRNTWKKINGEWFYFGKWGYMKTGWLKDNGEWFYLNKWGVMKTGWIKDNGEWFYLNKWGVMQTGWLTLPEGSYYLNKWGVMQTGWLRIDNKAYYLEKNGLYNPNHAPSGSIALTFDDGPGKYTNRLLNALEKNKAHATFFLVGQQVASYAGELRRMEALGCEIGNHSYSHKRLTKISAAERDTQLSSTENQIASILGHGTTLIRPPYGEQNSALRAAAGKPLILWSIDTLDWKTKNAQATINTVLSNVRDGDIILMHDIHATSVDAAEVLIPELLARGYELLTVSELAQKNGVKLTAGKSYSALR